MSYNPIRAKGTNFAKKKKVVYKNHGSRHSDIVRKRGVGVAHPLGSTERTFSGFKSESFRCDNFVQYYERLDAGNNKGFGINRQGDRVIFLVSGSLFVTKGSVDEKGNCGDKDTVRVAQGGYIKLPRGTGYEIATSGTMDVEMIVTETPDYDKTWEPLGDITIREVTDKAVMTPKTETPVTKRRDPSESRAMRAAQKIEKQKRKKRARQGKVNQSSPSGEGKPSVKAESSSGNINSSTTIGVNPKAVIPTED